MIGAMLRSTTGLPVVTTVHSDYRLDYMGRPLSRLTYGTIKACALRKLDYRIGVSDAMVDLLIRRGFPPDRFYAIYNGLDFTPPPQQEDRIPYLRQLGADVDENSVVVGIAARLNPVKDMSTLIRGFAVGYAQCPRLRLIIAGDGPSPPWWRSADPGRPDGRAVPADVQSFRPSVTPPPLVRQSRRRDGSAPC